MLQQCIYVGPVSVPDPHESVFWQTSWIRIRIILPGGKQSRNLTGSCSELSWKSIFQRKHFVVVINLSRFATTSVENVLKSFQKIFLVNLSPRSGSRSKTLIWTVMQLSKNDDNTAGASTLNYPPSLMQYVYVKQTLIIGYVMIECNGYDKMQYEKCML